MMQRALRLIYPSECLICRDLTESDFGLCGPCWRDTPFVMGVICQTCGVPLPGEDEDDLAVCDDCMTIARPWSKGRTALRYSGNGRKMVLGLKHGDRTDLAKHVAGWMAAAVADVLTDDTLLVPVPLHWTRLLGRRYNQSALLAQAVGARIDRPVLPDGLVRVKRTASLGHQTQDARFAVLDAAIAPHPKRGARLAGRTVLIVDDVMTSGATLAASCDAAHKAGAKDVNVLTLARAVKDD